MIVSRSERRASIQNHREQDRVALDCRLRLTLEETRSIACATQPMDEAVMSALHRLSHRWATGLTLMLERIRRLGVTARHVETRAARPYSVLRREILDKAPPDHQHPADECIPPRMTATAAAAISGMRRRRQGISGLAPASSSSLGTPAHRQAIVPRSLAPVSSRSPRTLYPL